ncbi:MAG: methyltransferase type 11 [Pedobacter sp.]|jgi:ubiquinone/menaquinone biosynthesis C-methylase UbiE|nr:methyltransferase type 11 [Pedobacter sp.]
MEAQFELIREQQRQTWNKFSAGWKKWDAVTMDFLQPMGDEMVRILNLKDNDQVLDIATGTGEPGLTIAGKVKAGKVVLTDLSEDMLQIARENAAKRQIPNIETSVCDVCSLPFKDYTFDAISCRFGFMFFPDLLTASKEMLRVLKPGGKLATAVWNGPEKNFWVTAIMAVINRNIELPPPLPNTPSMFRCAQDGMMTELLVDAGFKNIAVEVLPGKIQAQTIDLYWQMMNEIVPPIAAALANADDALKQKIKKEVYQVLIERYPNGNIESDSSALIIYAEKEQFKW